MTQNIIFVFTYLFYLFFVCLKATNYKYYVYVYELIDDENYFASFHQIKIVYDHSHHRLTDMIS